MIGVMQASDFYIVIFVSYKRALAVERQRREKEDEYFGVAHASQGDAWVIRVEGGAGVELWSTRGGGGGSRVACRHKRWQMGNRSSFQNTINVTTKEKHKPYIHYHCKMIS
jgi:hypothetical protein